MNTLFLQFSFSTRLNLDVYLDTFGWLIQLQGRDHADNGVAEQRFDEAVQFDLLAVYMDTNGFNILLHNLLV